MSIVCSSFCLTCCCLLITAATTIAGECTNRHAICLNVYVYCSMCVDGSVCYGCSTVQAAKLEIHSQSWELSHFPSLVVQQMKWTSEWNGKCISISQELFRLFPCNFCKPGIFHVKNTFIVRQLSEFDWIIHRVRGWIVANICLNGHNKSALMGQLCPNEKKWMKKDIKHDKKM